MKYPLSKLIVLLVIAALSGCSTLGGKSGDGVADVEDLGTAADQGAVASGAAGAGEFAGYSLDDPASPLSRRVVYFAFDSSEIAAEDQDMLAAHASYLASHGDQDVTLEGHADERGSREYNIALGERRAQAVRRVFELQGISAGQVTVVSYGEEKPAAEGHSEAAWRLNRRVEIIYPGH